MLAELRPLAGRPPAAEPENRASRPNRAFEGKSTGLRRIHGDRSRCYTGDRGFTPCLNASLHQNRYNKRSKEAFKRNKKTVSYAGFMVRDKSAM